MYVQIADMALGCIGSLVRPVRFDQYIAALHLRLNLVRSRSPIFTMTVS